MDNILYAFIVYEYVYSKGWVIVGGCDASSVLCCSSGVGEERGDHHAVVTGVVVGVHRGDPGL